MKTGRKVGIILFLFTLLVIQSTIHVTYAHEGEVHQADDHCDDPVSYFFITAIEENGTWKYDQDKYYLEKDTCYTMTFVNPTTTEHDVHMSAVSSPNGMDAIHLHLLDNKAGPEGLGRVSMNILTPDSDAEFTIYCTIGAHRSLGMEAVLVVGDGYPDLKQPQYAIYFILAISLPLIIGIYAQRRY